MSDIIYKVQPFTQECYRYQLNCPFTEITFCLLFGPTAVMKTIQLSQIDITLFASPHIEFMKPDLTRRYDLEKRDGV